jgi:hypothetical protein
MIIRKTTLALPILGLLIALALSSPARADTLNLSLADPVQYAVPGSMVSFIATASAPLTNLADVYLNADSTTVDYPLTLDDSPFIDNYPLFLAPGDSYTGVLFTVTVPTDAVVGTTYAGYFEIDGGADSNASNDLASVTFDVSAVPEPGSVILQLAGLFGLLVASRRKLWLA